MKQLGIYLAHKHFISIYFQYVTVLLFLIIPRYNAQVIKISPLKIGASVENVFASTYYNGYLYYCSDKKIITKQKSYLDEGNTNNYLNIYRAKYQWGQKPAKKSEKLTDSISSKLNEGPLIFNLAKNEVFFSSNIFNSKNDSTLRLGLFTASYNGSEFGKRKAIEELRFDKFNVAHPALLQNDSILIFVSDKNQETKSDLYFSKLENGTWSQPQYIDALNSSYNETFPTVYNNLIYFSSDRIGGQGGLDLYVSAYVNGIWLEPKLLSAPINSAFDDFLLIPVTTEKGVFSSNRTAGNDRIFEYEYLIPLVENFKQQDFDTCFTFIDENIENRAELEYTWIVSDGATYKGNEINHCFSKMGTYTVSCSILEKNADSLHQQVDITEITISCDYPLIQATASAENVTFDCNQKFNPTKYSNWYWNINGINYYEKQPSIRLNTPVMDVKLILWNTTDPVGIQKTFIFKAIK